MAELKTGLGLTHDQTDTTSFGTQADNDTPTPHPTTKMTEASSWKHVTVTRPLLSCLPSSFTQSNQRCGH